MPELHITVIVDDNDIGDVIRTMPVRAISVDPVVAGAVDEPNEDWREWYPI